jgi:tetratricopeptide (TPR) repeat protein
MKQVVLFMAISLYLPYIMSQIDLNGVITVQNSKVNTGETVYVPNAQVSSQNAQPNTTDSEGKFTLRFTRIELGRQVQILVTPYGAYKDYVVVNEKELQSITLGRLTPISIYICKKGELEQRQAEMVGINMRKFEERIEADKKRLQKELDELKSKNDYLNTRYDEIKDSLNLINTDIDKAFERIKEYAKSMVLENLDGKDDNYVKAYDCFSRGELDSVSYYLQEQELTLKHKKILQLQEDAQKEEELATILTELAKAKKEYSANRLNELIQEWLLLARTYNMKNDSEKTITYYENAINADTLNVNSLSEYARYLYSIKEYAKAESYYLQCLERYRTLEKENSNAFLADVADILNDLAIVHWYFKEYPKALEEYEEALAIRRKLVAEVPQTYLDDVAQTLNNMAILHGNIQEFTKASEEYEEALEIRRNLAVENPKVYLVKVALTLENLAILHYDTQEYSKALIEYEEALEIMRNLVAENPKSYIETVARVLNNLGNLHEVMKEYSKALEEYTEALEINRNLAVENPKIYLVNVANTLINLGELYQNSKEYPKALKAYEESLEIFQEYAAKNPKVYTEDIIWLLNHISMIKNN